MRKGDIVALANGQYITHLARITGEPVTDLSRWPGLETAFKAKGIAVAISKGETKPARSFTIDPVDVKAIRERAALSQNELAAMMRVSVRTLQNWEQGRRKPTGPASALIRIFEKMPQTAVEALKGM